MKNKRIILFLCLFAFACNSMKAQRQDSATSFSRFKIMVNPLLILGQKEYGGLFEYYIKKNFSVEVGGGVNLNYSYPWETSYEKIKYGAGDGYTIRAGLRYYLKSGFYFNPIFFYRNMRYKNRYYESGYGKGSPPNSIYEPGAVNVSLGYNGADDIHYGDRVYEIKQVFSFELLFGKKILWKRMPIDIYAGVGYRNKYKQVSEIYYCRYRGGKIDNSGYLVPPIEKNIHGGFPTIQAGFQIGFLSKRKK